MAGLVVIIIIIAGLAYICKRSNKVADSGEDIVAVESNNSYHVCEVDRGTHSVYNHLNEDDDVDDPQTHNDTGDHSDRRLQKERARPVKRFFWSDISSQSTW